MKTSEKILFKLKSQGELNVKLLAEQLSLTTMGVRQHLQGLEQAELVEHFERKAKVGRPTRYWRLSAKGHAHFPDSHADLSSQLIEASEAVFGEVGLQQMIEHREQQSLQSYQQLLQGESSIERRLELFSQRRSEEGYMASWSKHDQGYWFVEDHCPICSAASKLPKLCQSELNLLKQLFAECSVSREQHIVQGERRCAYRIVVA